MFKITQNSIIVNSYKVLKQLEIAAVVVPEVLEYPEDYKDIREYQQVQVVTANPRVSFLCPALRQAYMSLVDVI